jgi:UDP-N-acetylmuramoyl-tripeptide--D-alanyl-D-alanine ligase
LEFFGSLEGSAQAKAEMLDLMPPDGAVVLNADDANFEYLAARARCKVVSFGLGSSAQVTAENVSTDAQTGTTFQLVLPGRSRHTSLAVPVHGLHNVSNALAASAVGYVMGMSGAAIARGLARFRPASMRSEVGTIGGVTVINDCYNANPASMKAAIDLLTQLGSGRRTIAVLGDMLELGRDARKFHREVGLYLGRSHVTDLVAVGALGHSLAEGARSAGLSAEHIREVADAVAAASALQSFLGKGDVVLIKGSRGIRLEHVVEQLRKMFA